jgi:hypothetical protein
MIYNKIEFYLHRLYQAKTSKNRTVQGEEVRDVSLIRLNWIEEEEEEEEEDMSVKGS